MPSRTFTTPAAWDDGQGDGAVDQALKNVGLRLAGLSSAADRARTSSV